VNLVRQKKGYGRRLPATSEALWLEVLWLEALWLEALWLSVELRRARSNRISEHGVTAEEEQQACNLRHGMPPPVRVECQSHTPIAVDRQRLLIPGRVQEFALQQE
jgi:hypothetical protein